MSGQSTERQLNKVIGKVGWNAAIMGGIVISTGFIGENRTQLAIAGGGAITLLALVAGLALCARTRFHEGVFLTIFALAEVSLAVWRL